MQIGFGLLRLSSTEFWAMTPREIVAAAAGMFGPPASSTPLARRDLLQLMKRFPDT